MNQARLKVLKARDDMIGVSGRASLRPQSFLASESGKRKNLTRVWSALPGNAERGPPAAGERGQRPSQVFSSDGRAPLAGGFKCG